MSSDLADLIRYAPPGEGHQSIVVRYKGSPVSEGAIENQMADLRKRSGVNPRLVLHSLRHTAASALFDLTKDIRAVQLLLGHRSINSTLRYIAPLDPTNLRPLMQQLWTPKGPVQ